MRQGFTLIELILYMGVIAIMIPSIVIVLLQVQKNQQHVYIRTQMENTAAIIISDLNDHLTNASKVLISSSTLDSDQSILVWRDADDILHRMQYATDTVYISDTAHNIGRLQFFNGENHWFTSENIVVSSFRVEPVRNSVSALTGLNVSLTLAPIIAETTMDASNILELHSSVHLPVSVTEE